MQTFDDEKWQDNTRLLKEYAARIRAIGDKENNAGKTESGEE